MNTDEIVRALGHRADAANKRGYSGEASEWLELADLIESLQAQLATSQARERVAVEQLRLYAGCHVCKHRDGTGCVLGGCYNVSVDGVDRFEWVGPQEAGEGTEMTKLQALNSMKVMEFSCCGEELEYVFAELNTENIKTLLDAGFSTSQIDQAMGEDTTEIDLALLGFEYAGAKWWSSKGGFTTEAEEGGQDGQNRPD